MKIERLYGEERELLTTKVCWFLVTCVCVCERKREREREERQEYNNIIIHAMDTRDLVLKPTIWSYSSNTKYVIGNLKAPS